CLKRVYYMDLSKSDSNKRIVLAMLIILIIGAALQFFLWSRQWVYGDQIIILKRGLEFADSNKLASFGKGMSGNGRIPGSFLQLLTGASLKVWPDFRSPALLIGISHLVAVMIICLVLINGLGMRSTAFFLAIYWLSPWRLYHSGFLWEPGFLFLPAAVHLASSYRLRYRKRLLSSAVLVATIVLTMQIHASFMLLLVSTAILIFKKKVRLHLAGALAGLCIGSLTLIPTILSFLNGDLPRLAPNRWENLPPVILEIGNLFKGTICWFRLGSLDIGQRISSVAHITEMNMDNSTLIHTLAIGSTVLAILAIASVIISFIASWQYFRGPVSDENMKNNNWHWIRFYSLSFLISFVIVSLIAPVGVQGWHFIIALPAACLPMAFWFEKNLLNRTKFIRTIALTFIVLQILIAFCVGLGNHQYVRPANNQQTREQIPSDLQKLFHSYK
ncbi:hypothetical protein J7M07_00760, partial [bacterium]|nr:hypothetical protein [bacterium]